MINLVHEKYWYIGTVHESRLNIFILYLSANIRHLVSSFIAPLLLKKQWFALVKFAKSLLKPASGGGAFFRIFDWLCLNLKAINLKL